MKRDKKLHDEYVEKHDFISLYLKNNNKLTNKDLRDISLNLIIAGRDTTRTLLTWFLYVINNKNDIKDKILKEIKDIDNDNISYDDANKKLNYLEKCLLETQRLYPSVPTIGRKCIKECVLPGKNIYVSQLFKNFNFFNFWIF